MARPFRFAAQLSKPAPGTDWAGTARQVEDLGYSVLTIPDHFDDQLAPLAAMMAAADATSSLRVGTLVLDNDYRHPLVLAKEAATIDLLSGGRLEFGLGAGWMTTDYEQSGIAHDRAGVRIERFEEGLEIIKGLFAGEPFSFSGRHYTITNATGTPKPVQQPHPPIVIGAGAPRMLGIAGREADIVNVNFDLSAGAVTAETGATGTAEATEEKIAILRDAAGDRFDDIELATTVFVATITDDRDSMAGAIGSSFDMPGERVLQIPHFLAGTVDQICDDLEARRERYGFSYIAFSSGLGPETFRAMAPVVNRLAGR